MSVRAVANGWRRSSGLGGSLASEAVLAAGADGEPARARLERRENVIFLAHPASAKPISPSAWQSPPPKTATRLLRHARGFDHLARRSAGRRRLQARLKVLTHPAVLVVDEIGYLPISRTGAMLFFQLMTRRYEHASTVLTSNKGFEEWGEIFGDDVMARR